MKIAARLLPGIAALAFAGCHTPGSNVPPEEESATKVAADELYQALIRDPSRVRAACMYPESSPAKPESFALVAAVRKVKIVKGVTPCDHIRHPDPGNYIFCGHSLSVRFAQLSFLKRPSEAAPNDSFGIEFSYEYGTPEKKDGVHLDEAPRYLIFAKPYAGSAVPHSDWYIGLACPF
jgi:hypothetical protein